ncbi:MAG: hypothetical protein ACT4PL_07875, partial [Phycisphaerales bacterium]
TTTGARPPINPLPPSPSTLARAPLASIADGTLALTAALARAASAPSLALQFARATFDILCPPVAITPPRTFTATTLAQTDLFRETLSTITRDPARATESYNRAALALRVPGIGPLATSGGRIELPLWRLSPDTGHARQRVYAGESLSGTLLPRALLMTGLLRRAGCELFIHGTGGGATGRRGGYDKVTERWLGDWLGWELAPSAVVSADLLLPLFSYPPITAEDAGAARTALHRAHHAPAMLGDVPGEHERQRLVELITDSAGDKGTGWGRTVRQAAYDQLHAHLAKVRTDRAAALANLTDAAATIAMAHQLERVGTDRTYSIALHEGEQLRRLQRAVQERLGVGPGRGE